MTRIIQITHAFASAESPKITRNETSESPTFTLNAAFLIKTSKRLAGKVTAIDNMPANSEFPLS